MSWVAQPVSGRAENETLADSLAFNATNPLNRPSSLWKDFHKHPSQVHLSGVSPTTCATTTLLLMATLHQRGIHYYQFLNSGCIPQLTTQVEKAREFQKNIYFCFIDYAKAFDCVDHNKLWKILKDMGISDHLTCLLRNLYAGQEEIEPDMEQQTYTKLEKEYIKAVYHHPAYLTYMQCTSREMLGWMRHKLDCQEKYQ